MAGQESPALRDSIAQSGQIFSSNPRYTSRVNDTSASAIYVAEDFELARKDLPLRAKDPYLAFTEH
jgi:UDP-3-O-[3-hydroxymyristoyl] glucosamine N-acyltransferase